MEDFDVRTNPSSVELLDTYAQRPIVVARVVGDDDVGLPFADGLRFVYDDGRRITLVRNEIVGIDQDDGDDDGNALFLEAVDFTEELWLQEIEMIGPARSALEITERGIVIGTRS